MTSGRLRRTWAAGRRSPLLLVGTALVATLAVLAVLAPVLAPHDPRAISGDPVAAPSAGHLLGTNDIGQDVFSQILWGARPSLTTPIVATIVALALGVLVGVNAGLLAGKADMVVTRLLDLFLAIPILPLLIVVAALVSTSALTIVFVLALVAWPREARVVRSQTLSLRQRGFVTASRGFGAGPLYVVRRHLAPALGPILCVRFVNLASLAIFLEAGLAFLGLGDVQSVSWGQMLNRAQSYQGLYFSTLWTWWVLPTGLVITVAILAFAMVGVGLEPIFNPRTNRSR